MGKKPKTKSNASNGKDIASAPAILTGDAPIDPLLASLFDTSAGPVKAPTIQYTEFVPKPRPAKSERTTAQPEGSAEDDASESADDQDEDAEMQDADQSDEEEQSSAETKQPAEALLSRKRKRGNADNLEDAYMQKLAREEQKENTKRKAEKSSKDEAEDEDDESNKSAESDDDDDDELPPAHETVSGAAEATELDKSNRTVFLGNVSNSAITSKSDKKTLLTHLSSFLSTLPKSDVPHKVESIRFRSTAYGTKLGVPRRAAFAHKEIMDTTASSTNAYIVYSTSIAAQKAPRALNGTIVLDRHLRVDNVAHPSAIDNKRCVFVGNLDFVGQETAEDEESAKKKKPSAPADIEEGLWRTFNANTGASEKKNAGGGNVESVRVVRDQATRVGKGFAYVQFYDSNCVEAALLLNGKKFPPLLPRKLRVTRARKASKKRETNQPRGAPTADSARNTLRGRAKKLLGRAGASKVNDGKPFIFEGQRAVEKTDQPKTKKARGGSKGRPNNRSSKRAALYRASGGRAGKKAASE